MNTTISVTIQVPADSHVQFSRTYRQVQNLIDELDAALPYVSLSIINQEDQA